jgi:tyrosinase
MVKMEFELKKIEMLEPKFRFVFKIKNQNKMKFTAVLLAPFLFSLTISQGHDNSTTTTDTTESADTSTETDTTLAADTTTAADTITADITTAADITTVAETTTAAAAISTTTPTNTCSVTIHRQEVREMSTANWESFVAAFKAMNQDGSLAKYVNWHKSAWTRYHWNCKFLPFHRAYLQEFEKDLIIRGAKFLPYWASTLDSQNPSSSPLLTAKYFGANDGMYIVDGPFARTAPMSYTAAVGGRPIIREYGTQTGAFYAHSLIDNEMNRRSEFSDFSKWLEYGPHSVVHSIIGGSHGQLATGVSPEDLLFWVHHCFMDKLWDKHQRRHGYTFEGGAYNENVRDTDEVGFAPWKKQVREVLRSDDICVSYSYGTGGGDNGEPNTNETDIRVPEVPENFFNGTGANLTFVEELANETKVTVDKINVEKIDAVVENKPKKATGFVFSVSIGLVTLAFTLI